MVLYIHTYILLLKTLSIYSINLAHRRLFNVTYNRI